MSGWMTNLSDEQIRDLVPNGVCWIPAARTYVKALDKYDTRQEGDLSSSGVADRVLRCESCGGTGRCDSFMDGVGEYPCPSCSPLRTLLLKLADGGRGP